MMRRFVELLQELDQTTSTFKKVESLKNYFEESQPEDACWAFFLVSGNKIPTKVSRALIHESFCEFTQMPMWLFKESANHVGYSSETMALLRGRILNPLDPPGMGFFIEHELLPLKKLEPAEIKQKLFTWWRVYDEELLFLIHKSFSGNLRVGVSKNLLIQAMSQVAGIDKETKSFRLMGDYRPKQVGYLNLLAPQISAENKSKPYQYFLASPVEDPEVLFTDWEDWCVEWKGDGIRAQLIKRCGEIFSWSRGEELLNQSFPDVIAQAKGLPDGTVLDGELLPFKDGKVLPFATLQTRLKRKKVSKKDLEEIPISIMVYDVLEWKGEDIRSWTLRERRSVLQIVGVFPVSELIKTKDILEAKRLRLQSRDRGVEGFMLKRWDSLYQSSRKRGDWWKWKIDPLTIDCVLLYAQPGTGRHKAGISLRFPRILRWRRDKKPEDADTLEDVKKLIYEN
jgi:DNA ligase-1